MTGRTAKRLAGLVALLSACGGEAGHQERRGPAGGSSLALSSPAFDAGGEIPRVHTCDGDDRSPPLRLTRAPRGTASFALVVDDPDAPGGTWVHWTLWNLPETTRALPGGVPADAERADGSRQGRNDFRRTGWGGPCPPPGDAHGYVFRLYALDARLDLAGGAVRASVDRAMRGHILGEARLTGRYARAAGGH